MVAVVILLRVLASGGNKLILQSGEVLTSFNNDNSANFSCEKKNTMKNSRTRRRSRPPIY